MSRLNELKKQYPELNISLFDIFSKIDKTGTYKYYPLLCKLTSKVLRRKDHTDEEWNGLIDDHKKTLELCKIDYSNFTEREILFYSLILDNFSRDVFLSMNDFIFYMEKNLIHNKDLSTYNTIDEIDVANSLASIKETTKVLEGQVIVEYEDDEWFVVKPLSFEASLKYGANTKWCTTSRKHQEHFVRYWSDGILVYFINRLTGYKFAGYKSCKSYDNELSFWLSNDTRVDSIELEIDNKIFNLIREIFKSKKTNRELCDDNLIKKVLQTEDLYPLETKYWVSDYDNMDEERLVSTDNTIGRVINIIDYETTIA